MSLEDNIEQAGQQAAQAEIDHHKNHIEICEHLKSATLATISVLEIVRKSPNNTAEIAQVDADIEEYKQRLTSLDDQIVEYRQRLADLETGDSYNESIGPI